METGRTKHWILCPLTLETGIIDLTAGLLTLPAVYRLQRVPSLLRKPQFMLTGSTLTDLQMMIISLVAILPAIPAIVLTWT